MTNLTIYKTFSFEASHVLPRHPGKCSRLHGHSWKLTVGVSGPVDEKTGFVVDYGVLSQLVKEQIINLCDHQHLGQADMVLQSHGRIWNTSTMKGVFGENFYPSSENLVTRFVEILQPLISQLKPPVEIRGTSLVYNELRLEEVSLEETCTCKAVWRLQNA